MNRHPASLGTLALVVATALSGCGGAARLPVPDGAVVHLGDSSAAAVMVDGTVEVMVAVPGAASPSVITGGAGDAGLVSVRLLSYGGETGEAYNTFVFGTAPTGAATVALSWPADAIGGQVWGGAWLIALPDKDVTPEQLHWQFKAADGSVVAYGNGILTP